MTQFRGNPRGDEHRTADWFLHVVAIFWYLCFSYSSISITITIQQAYNYSLVHFYFLLKLSNWMWFFFLQFFFQSESRIERECVTTAEWEKLIFLTLVLTTIFIDLIHYIVDQTVLQSFGKIFLRFDLIDIDFSSVGSLFSFGLA